MSAKINPTYQIFKEALDKGVALEVQDIRALRAQSKKAAFTLKSFFWAGIIVFNVALWVPLPFEVNKSVLYVVAFSALVIAIVVPMMGLRKHHVSLELLKVNKLTLKKKTVNAAGRAYIEQVKKQDRPFVNAEFELLEGSKWSAKAD